ncbi:hypothetical protein [Pontibacter pamirensis]|uniref:hypothetical protein n=1 Tax=Pontibacter pamirensis TaxID=2562824 RepID=UPI001389D25F|nr:hypothetical protein [Pontibacter pamirensis]
MTSSIGRVSALQIAYDVPLREEASFSPAPARAPLTYPVSSAGTMSSMTEVLQSKHLLDKVRSLQPASPPIAPKTTVPQLKTAVMPVNLPCNTHACTSPASSPSTVQAMTATQPAAPLPAPKPKEAAFPWWLLLIGAGVAFSLSQKKESKSDLSGIGRGNSVGKKRPAKAAAHGQKADNKRTGKVLKMTL